MLLVFFLENAYYVYFKLIVVTYFTLEMQANQAIKTLIQHFTRNFVSINRIQIKIVVYTSILRSKQLTYADCADCHWSLASLVVRR